MILAENFSQNYWWAILTLFISIEACFIIFTKTKGRSWWDDSDFIGTKIVSLIWGFIITGFIWIMDWGMTILYVLGGAIVGTALIFAYFYLNIQLGKWLLKDKRGKKR